VRNADNEVTQEAESPEKLQVLKAKFRELCNPLTNVIIERHRFNTRVQEASEPIQNFITALKILADRCEYETLKDSLIRDRIVCGVMSDTLRKQMLKERDLTLHKAIHMCQIHESAEKHTAQVSHQQEANALHQAGKQRQNQTGGQQNTNAGSKSCMYCGRHPHPQKKNCPAFGKQCTACKKMHHYAKVCKSRTNTVNTVSDEELDQTVYAITQCRSKNEIHCTATVNACNIKLKVDTGAKCNVLPLDIFQQVKKKETINKQAAVHLVAYG
jgi:hypothetical protein